MKPKDQPFTEDGSFTDIKLDLEVSPRLVAVASRLRAHCAQLEISFEDLMADLIETALIRIDGELALRGIKGDPE